MRKFRNNSESKPGARETITRKRLTGALSEPCPPQGRMRIQAVHDHRSAAIHLDLDDVADVGLIAVSKVGSIGPESEGVSIQAKVVGIAVEVERESSGGTARAADVCIGDETGCVMVTVTDDQIDLMVPGKSVTFRSKQRKGWTHLKLLKTVGSPHEKSPSYPLVGFSFDESLELPSGKSTTR